MIYIEKTDGPIPKIVIPKHNTLAKFNLSLVLINNLTQKVTTISELTDVSPVDLLIEFRNVELPTDLDEGEYSYFVSDGFSNEFGLLVYGNYNNNKKQYDKKTNLIQYGG